MEIKSTKINIHKYLNCPSGKDIKITAQSIKLDTSVLRTLQSIIALELMEKKRTGHAILNIVVTYCPDTELKYSAEIGVEE